MHKQFFNFLLSALCISLVVCNSSTNSSPIFFELPGEFVYSIVEQNDSLYFSTQKGELYRFSAHTPDSVTLLAKHRTSPIRTIAFKKNGNLYASSYETGVHLVVNDSLVALPHLWQTAWAMALDSSDNIWLAGRHGVFYERGDTMLRFGNLTEAYDVAFFQGKLAVAHRKGVTLYDTTSGSEDTTFCKGVTCWALDVFDSLLVVGGVEICALIVKRNCSIIPLKPQYTIPWAAARDSTGTVFLATQRGLYAIQKNSLKAECIAYRNRCIKSVFIDQRDRVWVGRYFQ